MKFELKKIAFNLLNEIFINLLMLSKFIPGKLARVLEINYHLEKLNLDKAIKLVNEKVAKSPPILRLIIIDTCIQRLKRSKSLLKNKDTITEEQAIKLRILLEKSLDNNFHIYNTKTPRDTLLFSAEILEHCQDLLIIDNQNTESKLIEKLYKGINLHEDLPLNLFLMALNLPYETPASNSAIHTLEVNKIFKFFEKDIIKSLQKENIVNIRSSYYCQNNKGYKNTEVIKKIDKTNLINAIMRNAPISIIKSILGRIELNKDAVMVLLHGRPTDDIDTETLDILDKSLNIESILFKSTLSNSEKLEKLQPIKERHPILYNELYRILTKKFKTELLSNINNSVENKQNQPIKNPKLI